MIIWIKAYFLRLIKRPAIIVSVLSLLTVSLFLSAVSKTEMSGFACGIIIGDGENMQNVISKLENENTVLDVVQYHDEDEMLKALRRGDIRFAYIFDGQFEEKYAESDIKNTIVRFSKKDDIFASLADEIVFAQTLKVFAEVSVQDFVLKNSNIPQEHREETAALALSKYAEYTDILGDVFVYESGEGQVNAGTGGSASFPIRGFAAAAVFTAALLGMQTVLCDEEKALLARLSPMLKNTVRFISAAASALLVSAALIISVFLCSLSTGVLREILLAVLLVLSCAAFAFFVSAFIKKSDSVAALIPISVLAVIVLCPVFFDICAITEPLKYAAAWLPPYFYLKAAGGNIYAVLSLSISTAAYILAGLAVRRIRRA